MLAIPVAVGEANAQDGKIKAFMLANNFVDASNDALFDRDLQYFQKYRDEALGVTEVFDEIGLRPLVKYSDMLSLIATRFKGYDGQIFQFKWFDPFQKARGILQSSDVYFEWGHILWNIASFESMVGARVDRSTSEGIKRSCKCFQVAAGIYEFMHKNIS